MLKTIPIPAFRDNYIWLIIHTSSQLCLIIDPGEAEPVIATINELNLKPAAILLTHHHYDHIDGVAGLLKQYPHPVPVLGPAADHISSVTQPLVGDEVRQMESMGLDLSIISIPGHTRGHIAYYLAGMLFCGDTLFTGGCGRIFEGTAEQMYHSLQRLTALPDDTLIYCGHEYTAANLQFALTVEPDNPALASRISTTQQLRQQNLPTVPANLALERLTNPFLRCHEFPIKNAAEAYAQISLPRPEDVFRVIRLWKDSFKIK